MFGYLKIYKMELKLKDIIHEKRYYCALCGGLGYHIGLGFRIFVSFDVTIFLHLFDLLYKDKKEISVKCPLHPFQKRGVVSISETAWNFCSFLNAYGVYIKLLDDINDSKLMCFFRKQQLYSFRKNKKIKALFSEYQSVIDKTETILSDFNTAEKSAKIGDFDKLCNMMGDLYGTVCYEFCPDDAQKELFYKIGFIMGRWIYLSDAVDDYPKDIKKKSVNPICFMPNYHKDYDFLPDISKIMDYMQKELKKCFQCLPDSYQKTILLNVAAFGMPNTIKRIIHMRYHKKKEKKSCCKL
ncbi:MAG: hypothetical protein IJJ69_09775 [Oscillospiraceae bacterium]|nr:hypothetical protein [Oscillospiraceae bacterium]